MGTARVKDVGRRAPLAPEKGDDDDDDDDDDLDDDDAPDDFSSAAGGGDGDDVEPAVVVDWKRTEAGAAATETHRLDVATAKDRRATAAGSVMVGEIAERRSRKKMWWWW